ncbi:MAG: OmpA family protein, partial [Bacteroidia bacterium]|nr:OmpA family protein [Bacteroidia bacterium]
SKYFESEAEAEEAKGWFMKNAHKSAADHGVELEVPAHLMAAPLAKGFASSSNDDDYDLDQAGTTTDTGFDSFHSEKHGQHYFHFNGADGQPLFYSEGYQNDKSRDNGIRSVIKNSIVDEHFAIKEDENGKYFTLRAGNYQEIGRSKYFESETEAEEAKGWFMQNAHKSAEIFGVSGLAIPAILGGLGGSLDSKKGEAVEDTQGESIVDYNKDGIPDRIEHKTEKGPELKSSGSEETAEESKGRPWWLWLLLLLLLLLLLFFLLRGCEGSPFASKVSPADKAKQEMVDAAASIELGKMGDLNNALAKGYLDQATYEKLALGKVAKNDIDWATTLNGGKLVAGGLLTQSQLDGIKSGDLKWDWMQMKPQAEVFGGLGGLIEAKNSNYLDLKSYDSLRLGELLLENVDLGQKLSAEDLERLVQEGILTAENKSQLNVGEAGWNAIMSAGEGGKTSISLGAWGNIDDLLKSGVISQAIYDSLSRVGEIDLGKFDWEGNINLSAAAKAGLITPTLAERIKSGKVKLDWPNLKEIVSDLSDRNSSSNDLTPIPTFGPFQFPKNSSVMRPGDVANFNKLVAYLKKNESFTIKIVGHTDSDGSKDLNMTLGKERALDALKILTSMGVDNSRVETESAGESDLKVAETSRSAKAKNRRVEILINRN